MTHFVFEMECELTCDSRIIFKKHVWARISAKDESTAADSLIEGIKKDAVQVYRVRLPRRGSSWKFSWTAVEDQSHSRWGVSKITS